MKRQPSQIHRNPKIGIEGAELALCLTRDSLCTDYYSGLFSPQKEVGVSIAFTVCSFPA